MKTIFMSLGLAFLAIACSPSNNTENTSNTSHCKKDECCKDCSDECKTLCQKVENMTGEEKRSEAGKQILADCEAMCKKNECCKAGIQSSCKSSGAKSCCDHHSTKKVDTMTCSADSGCCKNCTTACSKLCKKVSIMSDTEKASDEGKQLLAECAEMCIKNGCCSSDQRSSCKQGEKSCCDHHE